MRLLGVAAGVALLMACGPDRNYSTLSDPVDDPASSGDAPVDPDTPPDSPADPPPADSPPVDNPPVDDPPADDPPADDPPPAGPQDSDGDGLTDDEEIHTFLTDPYNADTDGDGYSDSDEVWWEGTDPRDATDYPGAPGPDPGPDPDPGTDCSNIASTGNQVGQIADDFTLTNQDGSQTSLHDHCEDLVLLVSSASWCGPCQAEAPHLQSLYAQYESQGLTVMTLLSEGDVGQWAAAFGLQHPVLVDSGANVTGRFVGGGSYSIPTMHLIGPGGVVLARDTMVSEFDIIANLP